MKPDAIWQERNPKNGRFQFKVRYRGREYDTLELQTELDMHKTSMILRCKRAIKGEGTVADIFLSSREYRALMYRGPTKKEVVVKATPDFSAIEKLAHCGKW